jgi:signal transduction histidine kinase
MGTDAAPVLRLLRPAAHSVGWGMNGRRDLGHCIAKLSELATQQVALRRVAALVAGGISPSELFAAVAEEIARCLQVRRAALGRYGPGETLTVVAVYDEDGAEKLPVGECVTLEGDSIAARVLRTGRTARMDTFDRAPGSTAARIRELGLHVGVGAPIIVDGWVWGLAVVGSPQPEPLPPDTETQMSDFADLVATAIAAATTRAELQASLQRSSVLAEQQAALRRVATLVARGVPPSEVFASVAEEMARCLKVDNAAVMRFDADGAATVVSCRYEPEVTEQPLGERYSLDGENVAARVLSTGRPARIDSHDGLSGPLAVRTHELGMRCVIGAPIVVGGRVWGVAVVASSATQPLPPDTEVRIGDFADLVATGISNAATRAELIASRARIVAAADDARRRLERDLHDGAQQRLVSLRLQVRVAEAVVPAELDGLKSQLRSIASGLAEASADLQETSRGIHPAILSEGGLGPALKTLAGRCPVAVNLGLAINGRLPQSVEVATYYVVAEALTNAAKHAHASQITVRASVGGNNLDLSISDDGIGGADFGKGSGLIGLTDRVEALGGRIRIESPPEQGTALDVTIPLDSH